MTAYEQEREDNIRHNKERLAAALGAKDALQDLKTVLKHPKKPAKKARNVLGREDLLSSEGEDEEEAPAPPQPSANIPAQAATGLVESLAAATLSGSTSMEAAHEPAATAMATRRSTQGMASVALSH